MPLITMKCVNKRFGGATALQDVSLEVDEGCVHALVGENGAGKSTLGKVITGLVRPDSGEILIDDERVRIRGPRDALRLGATVITQELALVPARSVIENVFLGVETHRAGMVGAGALRRRYDELAERIGFDLPGHVPVDRLRVADKQKVEILRALARRARLIVMDEPTAALGVVETERLLSVIRDLADQGTTIIFISHFLDEVLKVSDTVTILRDGKLVRSAAALGETPTSLVTSMLGRAVDVVFPPKQHPQLAAPTVLRVDGLTHGILRDVSFELKAGEVLGLAGLVGSGRSEIAHAIFGASGRTHASICVAGKVEQLPNPRAAVRAGLALLPEDRQRQGLVPGRSVQENLTLPHAGANASWGVIKPLAEARRAVQLAAELDIRTASMDTPVSALSGGNQQKVAFGKWLVRPPLVLIADEPTRGVDIGAKQTIYELITVLAARGMGVLLISSEVEEVIGLAHRVLVMREGQVVARLASDEMTEDTIMRAAFAA